MKYKFRSNERIIEQDALEWVSLLQIAEANGAHLQGEYTPAWALHNGKIDPNNTNPFQIVTLEDATEMASYLKMALSTITSKLDIQGKDHHRLFHHDTMEKDSANYRTAVFLGIFGETALYATRVYPLEHFSGKNTKKISDLIQFLDAGEFEIDWRPIVEDKEES